MAQLAAAVASKKRPRDLASYAERVEPGLLASATARADTKQVAAAKIRLLEVTKALRKGEGWDAQHAQQRVEGRAAGAALAGWRHADGPRRQRQERGDGQEDHGLGGRRAHCCTAS